jgi:plastocyanin
MSTKPHITTRRAFVAAAGFGGVGLYGLWAAYGAAPGPLALLGLDGKHDVPAGEHAGATGGGVHGAAAGSGGGHGAAMTGPSPEDFTRMTNEFIERYRLPDGRVHPRRLAAPPEPVSAPDTNTGVEVDHASMGHGAGMGEGGHGDGAAPPGEGAPIEIRMIAGKYYYQPDGLRLDAGQPYRFRMMALDASHGASIQFGRGGRMMRLRPGRLTETEMTFHQPGRYLMICTVYCGAGHDLMQATIEVV